MSNLALRQQTEYVLVVLSGHDRGAQYKLMGQRISIGRSSENDISLKDDSKMSRNHAIIHVDHANIEIVNMSDKNALLVNGDETPRAKLTNGAIIQLGETKFQFKVVDNKAIAETSRRPTTNLSSVANSTSHDTRRPRKIRSSSQRNFYIVIAIVVLLFAYLLSSNKTIQTLTQLRTEDDIENQIKDHQKIIDEIESERTRLGLNTRQYEEAQSHFIKGFRDYQKGQYQRAQESFQACLSLFAGHKSCERYRNLAQKKFDELIQYHMVLANRYKAQNQFDACKSAYRNAMIMIGERDPKIYKEAEAGFRACEALEGDRY